MRGVGQVFEMAASGMATQRAYGVFWVAMTQQRAERWLFRKGTTQMRDYDKSAVGPGEISVKLRGPDNGKLPRTPYNVESAVAELAMEGGALNGDETLDRMLTSVLWVAADNRSQNGFIDHGSRIPIAVEMLINDYGSGAPKNDKARALEILSQIADIFEDEALGRNLKVLVETASS